MTEWAAYVARLAAGESQVSIARRTGIDQATISRWLRGELTPNAPARVARFAQTYGGNVLEAFVAAGFLSREEAGMPPEPHVDFYALIDGDPDLSSEAKAHIKNQYGLLKQASRNAHALSLREEILNNPALDADTRTRLLAALDDTTGTQERRNTPRTGQAETA